MAETRDVDRPVVEQARTAGDPELTLRALQERIRQQEILAELGVSALQGAALDKLLTETARLTAEGLNVEFCKVLEYLPDDNRLLVVAGVGWDEGVIGVATIGADLESPAGYALKTGTSVISNHLKKEERFRTPELMIRHDVRRAMNVILQGDGKPFGVLEVDSRSDADFVQNDLAFLQGAANILGMAIERDRRERQLNAAIERDHLLLQEMNHRVKNSLSMVVSLLHLQARDVDDPKLTGYLHAASDRVLAIARAHDQLSYSSDIARMDIGQYVRSVCKDLDRSLAQCEVLSSTVEGISVSTDRAVSVALIINELIANAAKYAYRGEMTGKVWVKVDRSDDSNFTISVRDEGVGLSSGLDPREGSGLGMRLIAAFAKQLGATTLVQPKYPGTEFIITIPV